MLVRRNRVAEGTAVWVGVTTALWSLLAHADIVTLKNGAHFRGIVTSDAGDTVDIQSDGAVWSFHRTQIAKVELEAHGRAEENKRAHAARRAAAAASQRRTVERQRVSREAPQAQVVVYGTSWCGYCRRARAYFASRHIPYLDKDVEQDPDAREEVARKCLAAGAPFDGGVPVLDVNGQILRGFSIPSIEEALQRRQTD